MTIESVKTEIPVSSQGRTGQCRHDEMSAPDRPEGQLADPHGLRFDGSHDSFQHDPLADQEAEFGGNIGGQDRSVSAGIDHETIGSVVVDAYVNHQVFRGVGGGGNWRGLEIRRSPVGGSRRTLQRRVALRSCDRCEGQRPRAIL